MTWLARGRRREGKSYTAPMGGSDTGWRGGALALTWLAGVALHLQERSLEPTSSYAALLVVGVLVLIVGCRLRRLFALALLGAALCGAGASGWRAASRMADALQ